MLIKILTQHLKRKIKSMFYKNTKRKNIIHVVIDADNEVLFAFSNYKAAEKCAGIGHSTYGKRIEETELLDSWN